MFKAQEAQEAQETQEAQKAPEPYKIHESFLKAV